MHVTLAFMFLDAKHFQARFGNFVYICKENQIDSGLYIKISSVTS